MTKRQRDSRRMLVILVGIALVFGTMAVVPTGMNVASAQETVNWQQVDEETLPATIERWVQVNSRAHGIHVLPAGDTRYLLVSWGEKPTGGYRISINGVTTGESYAPDVIKISVQLGAPGPGDNVIQVITYPYLLVELPAGNETVLVNFHGSGWDDGTLGEPTEDDLPIVLQADTQRNDLAPNPLVVRGRARVFEAMMNLVLEDGHSQLRNHWLMLAAGGPEWAEFEVALTYPDPSNPHGAVIGSYENAGDGSLVEVATEPVEFGSVSSRLPDVDGHWAEASIRQGVRAGFITGYPDGMFNPERTVTRAEFLKMLVAAKNAGEMTSGDSTPFTDTSGHWVEPYLHRAVDAGWVSVEEDGSSFRPDEAVSRQIMTRWASRAAGLSPVEEGETSFSDNASIQPALVPWVAAAVDAGILQGYPDGTFHPTDSLKRSEAVTVVLRTLDAHGE